MSSAFNRHHGKQRAQHRRNRQADIGKQNSNRQNRQYDNFVINQDFYKIFAIKGQNCRNLFTAVQIAGNTQKHLHTRVKPPCQLHIVILHHMAGYNTDHRQHTHKTDCHIPFLLCHTSTPFRLFLTKLISCKYVPTEYNHTSSVRKFLSGLLRQTASTEAPAVCKKNFLCFPLTLNLNL